jgi:hypothetical protein
MTGTIEMIALVTIFNAVVFFVYNFEHQSNGSVTFAWMCEIISTSGLQKTIEIPLVWKIWSRITLQYY